MSEKIFNTGAEGLYLNASEKQLEEARSLVSKCSDNDKIKIAKGFKWMTGMINGVKVKYLVSPNNFSSKIDLGFKFE